jgi:hypothetical protein
VTADDRGLRARRAAARLGRVGAWSFSLDRLPVPDAIGVARTVEELGFGSLWIAGGTASREALSHAAILLGATSRLVIATGIASIWARDPAATASGARALADAFPGRFILGLGVSHVGAVSRRGHEYARPLTKMREYLDGMDGAPLASPAPDPPPARVLARTHTSHYLARENYWANLAALGMPAADLDGGRSDAAVDTLVAWGDEAAAAARVAGHLAAGADHVVLQPITAEPSAKTLSEQFTRLAAVVKGQQ